MDMDGGRGMKELKQSGLYTVGIGYQDFGKIRREHIFYVDKTAFIREWWERKDEATFEICLF